MFKKILLLVVVLTQLTACAQFKQVLNQLPNVGLTNEQMLASNYF